MSEYEDFQYEVEIDGTTILAGSVPMFIPEGGNHVRQAFVRVPRFKRRPVITATVQANDSPGNMFAFWSIEYVPAADHATIKFSAQATAPSGNDFHYFCDFNVVGEIGTPYPAQL